MPVKKGQKYNIQPKQRMKKVFDKIVESGGAIGPAMVEAGYSPKTAVTPSKLTKTKGWEQLLQKHISDAKLAKVLEEGLGASKEIMVDGKPVEGLKIPDYAVRHKYLETGLKLKAKFPKEGQGDEASDGLKLIMVQINNVINNNDQGRQTPTDL